MIFNTSQKTRGAKKDKLGNGAKTWVHVETGNVSCGPKRVKFIVSFRKFVCAVNVSDEIISKFFE